MARALGIIRALVAACSVLLASCAHNQCPKAPSLSLSEKLDVTVFIEDKFTSRERKHIINGINMWEFVANGRLDWHLQDFHSPPKEPLAGSTQRTVAFLKSDSSEEWVKAWDRAIRPMVLLGYCEQIVDPHVPAVVRLWLVEDRLNSPHKETIIAAHEFGHALGLRHVRDKHSVMSGIFDKKTRCITKHDVAHFCDVFGCTEASKSRFPCFSGG